MHSIMKNRFRNIEDKFSLVYLQPTNWFDKYLISLINSTTNYGYNLNPSNWQFIVNPVFNLSNKHFEPPYNSKILQELKPHEKPFSAVLKLTTIAPPHTTIK